MPGNQSIGVAIRELATGRIQPSDFVRVWWAEAKVGLFNGFVLALELGILAFFIKKSGVFAVVVGVTLWINTILSVTIGCMVPLLLKRFKKDPALASSPILTTLTDLCGFFLMLTMASKFLV